jgi:hypothetical protein
MTVTLKQLHAFQPHVNGCKEAEPGLRQILIQYYCNGGFAQLKAQQLADEYIHALKLYLNTPA